MKLHTLGTGGPRPDPQRNSTCHVLEIGRETLMFDAGRGAIQRIAQKQLPFDSIDPLFVSHLHVDHIGELSDYLITSWLAGRRKPLRVFSPPGTAEVIDQLMGGVYQRDIAFRTEGETAMGPFIGAQVTEIRTGETVDGGKWRVTCDEMRHGHGLPVSERFLSRWICLGFRVEAEGKVFSFSGDGVMSDSLIRLGQGADLHLQCCYLARSDIERNPQGKALAEHTLACSDTAGKIARAAGVKKLVLTHFRATTPEVLREIEADVRQDCAGSLALANDLDDFDV